MQVTQLIVYPIKSTAGVTLDSAQVETIGLQHDRRYMLVNAQGRFITGRNFPQLTQVRVDLQTQGMEITAPGTPNLFLPYASSSKHTSSVNIWRDQCNAWYVGNAYDLWFSNYLQTPCHLVKIPNAHTRLVDQHYAQNTDYVSFADGFPILLISQASIADLNTRLQEPVEMARFRPNIVVDGCDAYAEDTWREARIGSVVLNGVKNCSRCIFTTIDPKTGRKHPDTEPLKTLSQYRKQKGGIFLGRNMLVQTLGRIRIGDALRACE